MEKIKNPSESLEGPWVLIMETEILGDCCLTCKKEVAEFYIE